MSAIFEEVPASHVVLIRRGVYSLGKLYSRNGSLYAGTGKGFVRLLAGHATSCVHVRWDEIVSDCALTADRVGRPVVPLRLEQAA